MSVEYKLCVGYGFQVDAKAVREADHLPEASNVCDSLYDYIDDEIDIIDSGDAWDEDEDEELYFIVNSTKIETGNFTGIRIDCNQQIADSALDKIKNLYSQFGCTKKPVGWYVIASRY